MSMPELLPNQVEQIVSFIGIIGGFGGAIVTIVNTHIQRREKREIEKERRTIEIERIANTNTIRMYEKSMDHMEGMLKQCEYKNGEAQKEIGELKAEVKVLTDVNNKAIERTVRLNDTLEGVLEAIANKRRYRDRDQENRDRESWEGRVKDKDRNDGQSLLVHSIPSNLSDRSGNVEQEVVLEKNETIVTNLTSKIISPGSMDAEKLEGLKESEKSDKVENGK